MNTHAVRGRIPWVLLLCGGLLAGDAPAGWFDRPSVYRSPQAVVADATGALLYVAEQDGQALAVVDPARTAVVRRIKLPGEPAGLAWLPDGKRLLVTCTGPRSVLAVVEVARGKVVQAIAGGHTSTGVAVSPDGKRAYVCHRFDGALGVIDLAAGREVARIPVGREPLHVAVTPDGKHVLVAHHLHDGRSDVDYVASPVSVVDVAAGKVVKVLKLPNGSTLLREIRVSPDGQVAAVAHTLARYQLPTTQLDRGWMNTSAITLIDLAKLEVLNTFLLDDVDRGAANPWGVGWTADGKYLCVSHAGTHELSVIDFPGVQAKLAKAKPEEVPNDLAFLVDLRRRVALGGNGPRGLAVAGTRVFTANHFSEDLSMVDLAAAATVALPDRPLRAETLSLGPVAAATPERQGERWWNDASICFQQWQSCASCHSEDARVDALNWDLLNDGIGNPKNNKSMLLSHRTPPAMSLGVRDTAETAVRAGIRFIQFTVQPPEVAAAIDLYLKALQPVPSPRLAGGKLTPAAKRGRAVFDKVNCASCHPAPLYTDLQQYDLGTVKGLDEGKPVDTPTLVECWRTAPYLHDGSVVTLEELFGKRGHGLRDAQLTEQEIRDLAEYVSSL